MAYTPIPVILDRMVSAGIEYERAQTIALAQINPYIGKAHAEKRYLLQVARSRIRIQYKLVK